MGVDKITRVRAIAAAPQEDFVKDNRLMIGSALFGAGWALSGLCPGSIIAGGVFNYSHAILLLLGYALGYKSLFFFERILNLKRDLEQTRSTGENIALPPTQERLLNPQYAAAP